MKNSPYMKIKKWENQLNSYYFHAERCLEKEIFCTYNKKRYDMICKNLDKIINNKISYVSTSE